MSREDCRRCEDDFARPLSERGGGGGRGRVKCSFPNCSEDAVTTVKGKPYCARHAAIVAARIL